MKISIVIPVYNVEKYIEECLLSVYNQTYKDIEVIIVDDCGSDNSITIAKDASRQFEGQYKIIFLKHEKNRGLSAARNTGIISCAGDYIYFLDSDDYITADCIENLVALAVKHQGVNIVQGNMFQREDGVKRCGEFGESDYPEYSCDKDWIFKTVLSKGFPITVCNKLISRKFILDCQLFFKEGIIHEDTYWSLLASAKINSIAFCYKHSYHYRYNPESIMHVKYRDRTYISNLMMLEEIVFSPPRCFVACPEIISSIARGVIVNRLGYKGALLLDINAYNCLFNNLMWRLIKSNKVSFRNRACFCYLLLPSFLVKGTIIRFISDHWKYLKV